jgi:S-adenosylmethionine:tRNA ribosyltransferase-isomerase
MSVPFIHPSGLKIKDYQYQLPEEKIARYPLPERDASALLIYKAGQITTDIYKNIAACLPEDAMMVFNETKVIHARLLFKKPTGGRIEVFCLEPDTKYHDLPSAMQQTGEVYWKCMVGGAAKWKAGQVLELEAALEHKDNTQKLMVFAELLERLGTVFIIRFHWAFKDRKKENVVSDTTIPFSEVLQAAGALPLPPYMNREAEPSDELRYQTVFAKEEGSVAAPTAALHFTPQVISGLQQKGISCNFLTLHVGAGTFRPVKSEHMKDHDMHAEWIDVSADFIGRLLDFKKGRQPVISVGTTSARTLESLYWTGIRMIRKEWQEQGEYAVPQWYPYDFPSEISAEEALQAVLDYLEKNELPRLITRTQIIIAPGYDFKIMNALVTNFHQPQSTLLLLVAALIGEDWRKVYEYALGHDFRFLSYGDGCLLFR